MVALGTGLVGVLVRPAQLRAQIAGAAHDLLGAGLGRVYLLWMKIKCHPKPHELRRLAWKSQAWRPGKASSSKHRLTLGAVMIVGI